MWKFLKKYLGNHRTSRPALRTRLLVESLESRDVPSCAGLSSLHGASASDVGTFHNGSAHGQHLSATLTGANGTAGTATFTSNKSAGTNSLSVSASGLTAGRTYDVQINGTTVGQVTMDTNGARTATLSNITAAVAAGATIAVVDSNTTPTTTALTGRFQHGEGRHHGAPAFSAGLTGATGTSGKAAFFTTSSSNNRLTVSVKGLGNNQTYTVQIAGTTVGHLTTDSDGGGHVTLTNISTTIAATTPITI